MLTHKQQRIRKYLETYLKKRWTILWDPVMKNYMIADLKSEKRIIEIRRYKNQLFYGLYSYYYICDVDHDIIKELSDLYEVYSKPNIIVDIFIEVSEKLFKIKLSGFTSSQTIYGFHYHTFFTLKRSIVKPLQSDFTIIKTREEMGSYEFIKSKIIKNRSYKYIIGFMVRLKDMFRKINLKLSRLINYLDVLPY